MTTNLTKRSLNEEEMMCISAGVAESKCASGGVQATLLAGCAVLGFFNPGIWVAGTVYFYHCNVQA